MIKAIVLDIGGVLLRTEDRTSREKLEQKYGLPTGGSDKLVFDSDAAQASTLGTTGPNLIWRNVADTLALSPEDLGAFKRSFWAGDRVDQELIQFLQECRDDYIVALLSNAWQNFRIVLDEKYQIKEGQTVDKIYISSELGVAKPDKRIYEMLADRINCEMDEILFIDDFIENIEAAKALGINTIHYQPGMDLVNEIKSRLE